MSSLIVEGGKKLKGIVKIDGAKNSLVAIIPSMLLVNGQLILENVPNIKDLEMIFEILNDLGLDYAYQNNSLRMISSEVDPVCLNEATKKYRGSYYFLGALLGRYKKVILGYPGGCNLGSRPIDIHIEGFEALGAKVEYLSEGLSLTAETLTGTVIEHKKKSVGATINHILASVYAKGRTIIKNASLEPEVDDVINFLCNLGFNVYRIDDNVYINAKDYLIENDLIYRLIPDRIETMTYLSLGLLTGEIWFSGANYTHIKTPIYTLLKAGADIEINEDYIIARKSSLDYLCVESHEYPDFPTDLIQIMAVLMLNGSGGRITENIFSDRFRSLNELIKMGANIEIKNNTAIINHSTLKSAFVKGMDLRGTASLVLAALASDGEYIIDDIEYMLRGYSDLYDKLKKLGSVIYLS